MNDFTAAADLLKQQQAGAVSPLARAAETMKAQQAGQVGMALTYDEREPDAVAKSQQVGGALGINPVIVGGDPEAYDLQLRMKQAAESLRQAPKTAAWLADRENGVLAKDDLDNLTWWERVLNAPAQGFVEMGDAAEGSAAGRMIERGVRRIPMAGDVLSVQGTSARIADVGRSLDDLIAEELAQVGGDSAPAPMRSMALMAAQVRFDAARDLSPEDVRRLLDRGSAALLSARERSDKIASIPMSGPATAFRDETLANAEDTFLGALGAFASDPIRGAAFAAEVAGEFLPAILGASAVTVVTRSPAAGALTLGTVSGLTENAASTMEFLAERGVRMETPEDAMAALQDADLMQAARDRGLTRGLVIGMMDAISGGVAGKTLMKSPAGDMIAQGLAQVGLGGGGEALGQLASGQNVSWKDIVIEGLAELVTAPIEVIGVGGRRLLRGAVKAGTAGETAETLAEADAQAAASRLKVRAPEKFREALEAQGLGDKTIHVPADALREYFQAKDVAFDEDTMRAWGIDPVTFDEAAQSGNAVAVPMSNYATYIAGTDAAAWFAENATTDPEELSLAEVRAFNMRVQDIMQDAFEEAEAARLDQDATRAADVQIYDDMFSQLREAGRSPDAARQEATMWAAFWRTMGERYGEDPLDMSRDMPVRVRGPQSPEFRRRDALDIALNTLRTKGAKALMPRGLSLSEFVKANGGVQDAGGDVAAMDAPKGVVAETAEEMKARASQPSLGGVMPAEGRGLSLDEMGRLAAEAGYFPDLMGEVNLGTKGEASDFAARLLDALSEDVAGRKVYTEGEGPDANLQALSDALSARGIDIATATNDEIAAALEATDGSTLNQGQDKPLYVVHNLSAENLRHALELGGLAAPSLAIARGDIGMDNFGEISLIGDPSMADPKGRGAKAFNADVYSPRQPRAQYDINGKPLRAMMDVLGDAASALQESPQGNIDPDRVSREGLSALENQDVVKMAYLMDIGDAPKVIYKKTEPIPTAMKKWVGKPRWEIAADPEFISALKDDIERQIAALPDDLKEGMREAITDRKLPGGEPSRFMVEEKARALAEAAGKRKVDSYETGRAIRKRMGKTKAREGQFRSWLEKKFGDVLGAKFFTNDAGRRKPYEIDAIVREMTRTVRDGEGWNYGVGSIRSTVAQQFKTIKQIQASRDKVVDSATMDKLKEEATNELVALADKFAPYHASSSDFGWLDIFSEFLKDLSRGRLREWQTSIFDEAAPPELIAEARAYLGKLSEMPTEYFEIKMQRAVGLDEFKAALVPSDASADTVKALKDAGLEVVKYKRDNEGRGRTEALQKLGEKVFFQSAPLKTDTPEFKAWFGDSKVVDANGEPMVVYHGTATDFEAFSPEKSGSKSKTGAPASSFFFTDKADVASSYTVSWQGDFGQKLHDGANVQPAFLSISKPLKVNAKGENWREILYKGEYRDINEIVSMAKESGRYDGVIVGKVVDKGVGATDSKTATTYVAFRPTQIKSVYNRGTFDPNDPRILYQGAADEFKVKPPKKLFRGIVEGQQESGESGLGTAHLGRGLYSTPDRSFAKKYATNGKIEEVPIDAGWPRNPLVLRGTGGAQSLLLDFVFRNTDFKNAREFNKAYPDPAEFVKSLGYDGVIAGDEVVRYALSASDRILYQPAYHGSPHIFDRFSLDKIGTGEGAQSFGWGLYFAGRKGVAQYYRENLTPRPGVEAGPYSSRLQYKGELFSRVLSDYPEWAATDDSRSEVGRKVDNLSRALWAHVEKQGANPIVTVENWLAEQERFEQGLIKPPYNGRGDGLAIIRAMRDMPTPEWVEPKGRLYKVDIPEDSDLLAWDAPLSEQSEKVRAALESLGFDVPTPEDAGRLKEMIAEGDRMAKDRDPKTNRMNREKEWLALANERDALAQRLAMSGQQAYYALGRKLVNADDWGKPGKLADRLASEALRDAGIPGHRFLDQGSRGQGDGSYNYVIYDDSAVSVLEFEQGKRGSIVLPSGGLGNGQTVINLFESADLSTLIHESGHFFLEAFSALASTPEASQSMRDDLATIRDFLGVKDGESLTTEQHEKWARGFEAYVMEGKAPSLALADAFARFKAWLTRIYRTARGLKVNITPEIREVMDRMLATDAEIKAAREEQAMRPLFADAPPGMSQTDFTTYQRMARRAVDQAEQSLMARVMAKVRREREAWYRAEKKAVLAEVTADVERRREYRLVDLLANQVWHGAVDGAEIPDMQIDRKALVEQFGDGVLAEVSRQRFGGRRAIYGDNGAAPEEVAQFFGFASAAEMVRTLQNAPRKRDAIAAEVERRMVERHGDPLNDGTIEEEALAAIHSEQQANLSVTEARHMARRLGRDTAGMTAKIYRHRAREMVGRMMVRDVIRPERFLASERKAARAAQDAFATVARGTGKAEQALAEALQAKEQQILNGFIYDEARKVAEYVQKGREKMRAYAKKSVREKLDGGYIEQIDAILEDYDFRIRGQRQIARAESLKAFVDRMIEEGREGELNVDARLIDAVNRQHYTKLSVDELRGLFDTVANIDHMGRFKQRLADRKRKRELQASADRVSGLIRKNLGTGKAGERHRIADAFNLLWRTDTLLIRMDGGEELGGAYDEIKRSIDEATSEEHRMNVEMAERLDALFKSHYSAADIRRMKVEHDIPGANDRAWSKLEILAVALNTGNEDNYLRLTAPDAAMKNRLTKAQVDVLLATMDENDWRFVQAMWGMVDSYWSGLAEVAQRRTGVVPKKVEAKLMVGAPSFVTGGYYPIVYDPALSASAAADEASAWDKFTATGRGATAAIRNGMTKQRAKSGGGRTLRLDVSVAFAHMRDTIRYIALSEAVDNTYRLVSHPDVQNAFLDAGAKDQHDILKLWLKDVAKGPSPSPDAFNTMFRIIKNNFTLSRLALNFKTVALQVTGVGQSAVVIGKSNMIRGYLEYLRNPRGTAAAVVAKSTFMRERRATFQKDIHDFMDDTQLAGPVASGYKKGKAVVGKIGFAPIVWTQFWAVDMPTWLGAFRAGVEKFGDEGKAAHYADRMVARAQDSGMMADRAAFERGTLSETTRQADVVRFFTTLGGYMLTKMNRGYVETMRARIGWRDADAGAQRVGVVLTAATNLALLYWTEAIITALLWSALGDDDDDDDLKGFLLRETGSAVVGGIPIIRDAYSALMGYGGGGIYGSVADAPARLLTQVAQGENDAALRRAIGDSVGMITGLPTTGPMRAIEGALSEDVPLSEALLGRNPLAR